MSYETVLSGLEAIFAGVPGMGPVLRGEPSSIQTYPTLYSELDRATIVRSGQVRTWQYRILHRMVFQQQDFQQAETDLIPFINAVPNAVDADARLGGRLVAGGAQIDDIRAVWVSIGGTDCRALDFYSIVVEK